MRAGASSLAKGWRRDGQLDASAGRWGCSGRSRACIRSLSAFALAGRASTQLSSSPTRVTSVTISRCRGRRLARRFPPRQIASTSGWHEPSRPGSSRAVDPDFAVVDGQAEQGGQHVLDHFDLRAVARERGAAGNFDPLPDVGRNSPRPVQIGRGRRRSRCRRGGPKLDRARPVRSSIQSPSPSTGEQAFAGVARLSSRLQNLVVRRL